MKLTYEQKLKAYKDWKNNLKYRTSDCLKIL